MFFYPHFRYDIWMSELRIRIRIHRIHMFLGPDPLVRGKDPAPDPSIIEQKL
jgi:hypothetical protein